MSLVPRLPDTWEERVGWAVLLALLLLTLGAAATLDRSSWPSMVGDEATYAIQAESLAWDLDLRYSRQDYDRFVEHWGAPPDGLILQSRDHGATLVYGKPPLYALAVAPFVRLAPQRGAVVANVFFLAVAALLSAATLRRRLGSGAPLWVAVFLFASVTFTYVFWIHADAFLLAAAAAGFALVYGGEPEGGGRHMAEVYEGPHGEGPEGRSPWRWLAAGVLLAIPGAFRPFYLPLLLPALVALPRRRRGVLLGVFGLGVVLVLGFSSLAQQASGGSWSAYAGERQGFYARTGYPDVDFPREAWDRSVERWGNASWIHPGTTDFLLDGDLWGWNGLYFLVGRDVGVLPYFLPLLVGFVAFSRDRGRWVLPVAVALGAAGFFLAIPFNFYGGTGAVANRYFLPLYPALWYLAGRPVRSVWALLVVALAAPFLYPVWGAPRAFPVSGEGTYHHVSAVAERWLPYETTQGNIPGGRDTLHGELWLRFLSPGIGPLGSEIELRGEDWGEILVGSPRPLSGLILEVRNSPSAELRLDGAKVVTRAFRPDGGVVLHVALEKPRARHPMWWTRQDFFLYRLGLALPEGAAEPVQMRLAPVVGPAG